MMKQLHLTNFKPWQDTGVMRLAPLTVLFGTNSSGKSSIQQFLLMLKQTADSPDRRRVFHAGGEGTTPVALGSFRDFVFAHDTTREIEFGLTWQLPKALEIADPKSRRRYEATSVSFGARVGQSGSRGDLQVRELRYTPQRDDAQVEMSVSMRLRHGTRSDIYDLEAEGYKLVRTAGRAWQLSRPDRFYGFPVEAAARYQNAKFTTDLALELERELRLVSYLGPLRIRPSRNYQWSGDTPEHVGWQGERTIDAVLAARDRRLNPAPHRKLEGFHELVARWLKKMGLIESFEIAAVAKGSDLYEARVRGPNSRDTVLLPDVGFGVSQVLPVVVACFYAPVHSTIIMEQPEIHLHPAVQSLLADLFIEAVRSGEKGAPRNVQLIVESHSEHFLRRLQRRIAEDRITTDEVALYFCERKASGAVLQPLEVDSFGNIRNWPNGFFGDEMGDVAAQARESLRRRMDIKTNLSTQGGE